MLGDFSGFWQLLLVEISVHETPVSYFRGYCVNISSSRELLQCDNLHKHYEIKYVSDHAVWKVPKLSSTAFRIFSHCVDHSCSTSSSTKSSWI